MATAFNGTLNANEIYASIYNMIISQEVFSNPIKGGIHSLADKFKTEGSEYGDTKLFYSVQIGKVFDWNNDAEAANLLNLHRAPDPACEKVVLDTFKMIPLTVDSFLSKRAFANEYAFGQFNSVLLGTLAETKKVYEATMVNTAVGTIETAIGKQTQEVELESGATEEDNRLNAQEIAKKIADILVDIQDVGREYNDLSYVRAYAPEDVMFVWNADFYNKITKIDLPTIFHKDGLVDRLGEHVLPGRYFGTVNTVSKTTGTQLTRALKAIQVGNTFYNAGDSLNGVTLVSEGEIVVPSYDVDPNVICKIIGKDALQYMSGFETQSEFFNPRSQTTNHYVIFGHSDLQKSRLSEKPWITLKVAE